MTDSLTKLFPDGESEESWARKRKRFVWATGVLRWGGFMFLCMTFLDWYRHGYIRIPPLPELLRFTIPNLIIWPVAGYWFGVMLWRHKPDTD